MRELAQTTSINPNTIQKAYKDLENAGFIYTVTGRGNFVAPTPERVNPQKTEALMETLKSTAAELVYLGVPPQDILAALDEIFPQKGGKV